MTANVSLRPKQLAVLREIVVLRDQTARTLDTPPRTLLRDDVLVRVARVKARTANQLYDIKGMPRPIVEWLERFVVDHYEPVAKKKRKRRDWAEEGEKYAKARRPDRFH